MGDRTYHLIAESPEDARYENHQAFFFFLFNLPAILTCVYHLFIYPLSPNSQAVLNMLHLALFPKACRSNWLLMLFFCITLLHLAAQNRSVRSLPPVEYKVLFRVGIFLPKQSLILFKLQWDHWILEWMCVHEQEEHATVLALLLI